MIDKGLIEEMKKKGEIIISKQSYNKHVNITTKGYLYKEITYKYAHWLLTWGRTQHYWLTDKFNNIRE